MMNVIAIMGRLVADPEMRRTTTGKTVVAFRIACDRGRKDANGQNQADFFDVTAWEKTGEFVGRYFQKGSLIAIDGSLQSRTYQDKSGNNRTSVEIVARNVNFAGAKGDGGGRVASREPDVAPPAFPQGRSDDFALIEDSDDLPF